MFLFHIIKSNMPKRRAIELQIIPGRQVIEEITSEIAELGAD